MADREEFVTHYYKRALDLQYLQVDRFLSESKKIGFVSSEEFFNREDELAVSRTINELIILHREMVINCTTYGILLPRI